MTGGRSPASGAGAKPRVKLVIEACDAEGASLSREEIDVVRPSGPVRQREQLVRAVKDEYPDALLQTVSDGRAVFFCRNIVMVASYAEGLEPLERRPVPGGGPPTS